MNRGTTRHQLVLPSVLQDNVLEKLHGDVWGGHLGEAKLMHHVQEWYYWPGYSESMKVLCRTCVKCAQRKSVTHPSKEGFHADIASRVFHADCSNGHNGTSTSDADGNKYVLVAVDCFTRWVEAYEIQIKKPPQQPRNWWMKYFVASHHLNNCIQIREDNLNQS